MWFKIEVDGLLFEYLIPFTSDSPMIPQYWERRCCHVPIAKCVKAIYCRQMGGFVTQITISSQDGTSVERLNVDCTAWLKAKNCRLRSDVSSIYVARIRH